MNPLRYVLYVFLLISASQCAVGTEAQKVEMLDRFEKGPHLGPPEEAVVGIEVTFQADGGEPITRTGNGFLLRCDGFVLAPSSLFGRPAELANKDYRGSVRVTLHPGAEQERRLTTTLPRKMANNVRYTVLKLSDVHIPAVSTLLPDGLETGESLEVVWSAYDAAGKRFLPVEKRKVPLAKPEPVSAQSSGTRVLTDTLNGVPAGAVVLGAETLSVGIITHGPSARFATLDALDLVTNCVTPLPTTEAEFAKKRQLLATLAERSPKEDEEELSQNGEEEAEKPADPAPGMVKVPGGPVRLTPSLLEVQKDMGTATTACVAPFLIDRYEVTNGQYLAFWKATAAKRKQDFRLTRDWFPLAWADQEPYFPEGLPDVPVLGVSYEGAKAYAKWVGKRLPAPYEWSLAAFGPTGGNVLPDWAKQYVADRQKTWQEFVQAHLDYLNNNPALLMQYRIAQDKLRRSALNEGIGEIYYREVKPGEFVSYTLPFSEPPLREMFLPWYFYRGDHIAAVIWSRNTVLKVVAPLFETYKRPQHVLPTGSRKFDVSPYGVYDMALNASEVVCPSPELREGEKEAHYMRTAWKLSPIWYADEYERLKQGETPFLPYFSWNYYGHGDIFLLSRRLRSTTTEASRGETVWPNDEPRSIAAANMYEIANMMYPLAGWEVSMKSGRTMKTYSLHLPLASATTSPTADGLVQSPNVIPGRDLRLNNPRRAGATEQMLWDEAASYPWWKDMPRYYTQEMGRPYDTHAPEGRNVAKHVLLAQYETYLVPGGFRCVR